MSSIASIMALVSALSPAEKLQLNVQFAASMVEKNKSSTSTRKGKPASLGTRAWTAFVAHVQETMPERFAPPALPKERLTIAGAIRLENPAGYADFCAKFKEDHPVASESEPEVEAPAAAEASQASQASQSQASVEPAAAAEPAAEAAPAAPAAPAAEAAEKAEKPKRVISDAQKAAMKAGREKAKAAKDAAAAAAAANA